MSEFAPRPEVTAGFFQRQCSRPRRPGPSYERVSLMTRGITPMHSAAGIRRREGGVGTWSRDVKTRSSPLAGHV